MYQQTCISTFKEYLKREEKSNATIDKYARDIRTFFEYLAEREVTKELTISYKEHLSGQYMAASVNSMLAAINCYLRFIGKPDCCVKLFKIQRQIFAAEERELSRSEYQRLVKAAKNTRLSLVLQTICATGIRVSELQYFTVEAVQKGKAVVSCKNKTRIVFIPIPLQRLLKEYIKKSGRKAGAIFVSRNGKLLNRSNIWREMKALCSKAGVLPEKVFPHNLRHLFARTFYSVEKDIVKLADVLGHSSINTTRIYTMETGCRYLRQIEQVQKILTT
jgi:integrase/recombinase XerD